MIPAFPNHDSGRRSAFKEGPRVSPDRGGGGEAVASPPFSRQATVGQRMFSVRAFRKACSLKRRKRMVLSRERR